MTTHEYLTMGQAARLAGYSTERLRQLARQGRLEVITTPYGRLVPREEAERLAAARRARFEQGGGEALSR